MPRGVPKKRVNDDPTSPIYLRIPLQPEDHAMLTKLAERQYRTPELQAAFLIARVLAEAGNPQRAAELAERIAQRAAERNNAAGAMQD